MTDALRGIDPAAAPSGTGCADCLPAGGWWFHLRRCTQCGNIGCCDTSPQQHATAHAKATGHPIIISFEPGEEWLWDFAADDYSELPPGVALIAPNAHPEDQPVPGPSGSVPPDWRSHLHM
ncbi:MAG: hypothetical protein JWN61_673 [Pseudonocardiales bacterium]|nr:hypothetical protein [Pseudonocardiales bacterium]